MSLPCVEIWFENNRIQLKHGAVEIVPARNLLIVISGHSDSAISLDGRLCRVTQFGSQSAVNVDMTRSVGFHRLYIATGHEYWFGTDDAKLGLDGAEAMLRYLKSEGLGWSGQLMFSDGSSLREPNVVYGWLDQHAERVLTAAEQVADFPHRNAVRELRVSSQGGGSVAIGKTMAMLRRRGPGLLEESEGGLIEFKGRHFSPRKVVTKHVVSKLDTPANRRVVWLTAAIANLIAEVLPELTNAAEVNRCRSWLIRTRKLLTMSRLSILYPRSARERPSLQRSAHEILDKRYAIVYEAVSILANRFGWLAKREHRPLYSYVEYVDEIYQAFVAYAVADALNLRSQAPVLRAVQPCFVGESWDMYYDVRPAGHVIRTWRSYTNASDSLQPDFLLRDFRRGLIVLADAKYRNSGARASEASRKDILVYMASFGLSSAMIFYPPSPREALGVHIVGAHGYKLVEVTVSPVDKLGLFLKSELRGAIAHAGCAVPWQD